MCSYGIPTDINQKEHIAILQNLIKDLVLLYRTNNLELYFQHAGNNAPGKLCSIPRAKSADSFRHAVKTSDFVESMISQLVSTITRQQSIESEMVTREDGVEWVLSQLGKKYEETFTSVSKKFGLIGVVKMKARDAAAMWADARVTTRSASTILTHLRYAFGYQIQVPTKAIRNVVPNIISLVPPIFGVFDHYKDRKQNKEIKHKPEKVRFWVNDFCELLAKDVESTLNIG